MDYLTLKQQIADEIRQSPIASVNSKALRQMIQDGSANYQTVAEYSKVLGDVASKSIQRNIAEGIAEEELGAFAEECLAPVYRQCQKTILNACKGVQKIYNEQADIQLNPVDVPSDESRITHIVDRFNEAESFSDVEFLTNSNVARSITRGAVQDSIRSNASFQSKVGLEIKISRSDGSGCCDWCSSIVGTYDSFESLPSDFWKIHRGCSCVIDYRVGKTRDRLSFSTNNGQLSKNTNTLDK